MVGTRIMGYTLNVKIGTKLVKGLETAGYKSKPNFEEILLKELAGVAIQELLNVDVDLTFAGKTYRKDGTESSSHEDFETLRAAALTGESVAFVYGDLGSGGAIVSGTGVIVDYGEDSNSKDTGTFSGSIRADKGSVTAGTSA